jgi:hypothetical protein
MAIVKFFFGKGWLTIWYLCFYLLTLPYLIATFNDFWTFADSADKSGGLGIFAGGAFIAVLFAVVTFVNSILFSIGLSAGIISKLLLVLGATIILPAILIGLVFITEGRWGTVIFYAYILCLMIVNLYMLYRFQIR